MNQEAKIEAEIKVIEGMLNAYQGCVRTWQGNLDEAKLAEAEKPELEDGDYGTATRCGNSLTWFWINETEFPFRTSYHETPTIDYYAGYELENISKQGNIFADLKAQSESLKKFTMKETDSAAEFSGTINKWTVYLTDHCHGTGVNIGIKDIPELILNLQRLVFTAGQELAK